MNLSNWKAVWEAFCGKDVGYYPRQSQQTIGVDSVISLISGELDKIRFADPNDAKLYIERAKDSLEESKKQTEYQDQKVARLLTIVAFLTAAAGVIFSKMLDLFPLAYFEPLRDGHSLLVWTTYLLFALYLVLVAGGALVAFHATQTRFLWPVGNDSATEDRVKTFLFFQGIIKTRPEAWGKAFVESQDATRPSSAMLAGYYRNYVVEAYVVAAKLGDKLRRLQPAQSILLMAIRALLVWFVFAAMTFALVPAPLAAASRAQGVRVVPTDKSGVTATDGAYGGKGAPQQPTERK